MEHNVQVINELVRKESAFVDDLTAEVDKVIVGQRHMVERVVLGLLAGGHVLLEGVPGLAKTLTVNTLATALHAKFQRIQFTPDLLPADLIGTLIYNPQSGQFTPKKGPIFANIILADEINRAPAKVQSALLEAMQERQVTIGDTTYPLDSPFIVMATQNPIDQEGTYQLPEAQVDRFMLMVKVGYPTRDEEREIIRRQMNPAPAEVRPIITTERIHQARKTVAEVYVDEKVKEYILDIVFATRDPNAIQSSAASKQALSELSQFIQYGASPRASIWLAKAARAHAFMRHRGYVVPEDIKAIAPDILRHRLITTYEAEAEDVTSDDLVARILEVVEVPLMAVLSRELLAEIRKIEIVTNRLVNDHMAGQYHSVFKGHGMSFDEVRPYMPGDDPRVIDWNVTARTGEPHVKTFVEERELTVLVVVDMSGSMAFGTARDEKRVVAAKLAAMMAFSAIKNGDRVGLVAFTDRIELFVPPKKGRKHVLRIIDQILSFEAVGKGTDLGEALRFIGRVTKRKAVVCLVSDFLDADYERPLHVTARRHDLIPLSIVDPAEEDLADLGILMLEDAETGELVALDAGSAAVRAAWGRRQREADAARASDWKRYNLSPIRVSTDARDYAAPLINYFRIRARRY